MQVKMLAGNTGYLDGHQVIGLYLTDPGHCVLLDSGVAALRDKIEQSLAEAGLTPVGVLCTHTHYDHFGNAAYFQKKYTIPVALPFGEAELCRTWPAVKSHLFVFTAGQIMTDPDTRDLPCTVDRIVMPDQTDFLFCGVRFTILHTPGHSPDHISVITPDRVCYGGDALLCGRHLTAAKLPYAYNFRQSLESFELFRTTGCDWLLLAHNGVIEAPFDSLVDENRIAMEDRLALVRNVVDREMSVEEIYTAVRQAMGIVVDTPAKALSLERFLRPYLECMVDDGTHIQTVRDGVLCLAPA